MAEYIDFSEENEDIEVQNSEVTPNAFQALF